MFIKAVALSLALNTFAFAGDREGNGGDMLRTVYMRVGKAIIQYLKVDHDGRALVMEHNLDSDKLEATLTTDRIQVVEGRLADVTGSSVDALHENGNIKLMKSAWNDHFNKSADAYHLVFHEMLRAAGVNDKDGHISEKIFPFPESRKVKTRYVSENPLLKDELLSNILNAGQITYGGTGCPSHSPGTYVDFDNERNIIDVTLSNMLVWTGKILGRTSVSRHHCDLVIPLKIPAGKKLIVTQLDVLSQLTLTAGAKATISTEVFLAGRRGTPYSRTIEGKMLLTGKTLIRETNVLETDCGGSPLLRVHTSANMQTSGGWVPAGVETTKQSLYLKLVTCAE